MMNDSAWGRLHISYLLGMISLVMSCLVGRGAAACSLSRPSAHE